MHKKESLIPMLEEVFHKIDSGKLDCELDEMVSYYFDEEDRKSGKICVSSFHQLMYLYQQALV